MRVVGGDVAVIDPCLLKGELSAGSITPLVHRHTRNLSTMIAAPDVRLIVRLAVILNVGLLRRRVSILTVVAAAGKGSPRCCGNWTRWRTQRGTIVLCGAVRGVARLGNPRDVNR